MGFKKFIEDKLRVKIKPNVSDINSVNIARDSLGDLLSQADNGSGVDLSALNEFRTITEDREYQYKVYDEMNQDSIISSALDMYADDATQYNKDGSIIWVESDDNDIAKFGNRLIDILDLNTNAWTHIRNLCMYGDIYLELFMDEEINKDKELLKYMNNNPQIVVNDIKKSYRLEEYIEQYDNPSELYDLVKRGKTIGFVKIPSSTNDDNILGSMSLNRFSLDLSNDETKQYIYDPKKFVHICLSESSTRFPEKLQITLSLNGEDTMMECTVKRGRSILHDIYKIYQELRLMEDSILLNRITRSSIIRILQVEVGDSTKSQVSNMLKRIKNMIEQKTMLDKNEGKYKSLASPGPIDNIIYVPTRNGKGNITMNNVGGDVDVKSIVDVDYYKNKLYGGLKIPKQFLGEDDGGGFSGGTSLTKLDARYARTVKRIQNSYIQGITNLINLFALDRGLDNYINNFKVRMVSPSTTEDAERDESMSAKMDLISSFIELLGDSYSDDTVKEIFEYFVSIYLQDNNLSEILSNDKKSTDEDEFDREDNEDEDGGFGSTSGGGGFSGESDFGMDQDFGDNEESEDSNSEEDFGSYEDDF